MAWEKLKDAEYDKLQNQWDKLFKTRMEVKSQNVPQVENSSKNNSYFFDEVNKKGFLNDELSKEERSEVLERFEQLLALRNKDKNRV